MRNRGKLRTAKQDAGFLGPFRLVVLLLAVWAGTAPLTAQTVAAFESHRLVARGKMTGKIYLPANAAAEEKEAAEVLAFWMQKVTGATAEIAEEPEEGLRPGIYVGATRQAEQRGIRAAESPGETWRWETRSGRTLFLLGNRPLATRLAAGDFLQRELGVWFLLPGEWGAEWEPRRSLEFPRRPYSCEPAFWWRTLGMGNSSAQRDWQRNNGLGVRPPFSHALHTIFTKETFAAHPEFFPVVGGSRRAPSGRGGYEPQPSLAAPGAANYAAGRAAAYFEKNPTAPTFAMGITDNMTWDETAATRELAPWGKYFRGKPDYSDYVFSFMNKAATALWPRPTPDWDTVRWRDAAGEIPPPGAVSEGKLLGCLAYYYCEGLPSFRLHPNVFPVVTADRSQWRDPDFRQEDAALLKAWGKSGARHFGVYDYYYGVDYLIPRVFLESEIDSIRAAADAGAKMFYAEIFPNWGFDGPKAWLAAQLLRNPQQIAAWRLAAFYRQAYGPAAPAMREFYEAAEEMWNAQPGPARWIKFWRMENMGALVSPEQEAVLRAALERAEAAFPPAVGSQRNADADERLQRQQIRVRMTREAFRVTEAFLAWYRLREEMLAEEIRTPVAGQRLLKNLEREKTLGREFQAALEKWRRSPLNPGAATAWNMFFTGDVDATVLARLLARCRQPSVLWAEEWAAVERAAKEWARQNALAPVARLEEGEILVRDGFEEEGFRPPRAGSWAELRPVNYLREPWRMVLFENETLRFGYSAHESRSGSGCLRIVSSEQTTLTRAVPLAGGEWIAGQAWCRGRINPGTYTALELRFYNSKGQPLVGKKTAVVHPATYADWRPVVVLARAPRSAVRAEVSIRSMSQEADEGLAWDDFSIVKLTEDEN